MVTYGKEITEYIEELAPAVEAEMEKVMPRDKKPAEVYSLLWEILDRGGKRFRPALCLLCCEAVGGKQEKALPVAAAIELFHNLTLIHDDIEDNSLLRRGKPCLHIEYGIPLALNAGDGLFMMNWNSLLKIKLPAEQTLEVQKILTAAYSRVMEGQGMELSWRREDEWDIREKNYLEMAERKTGALIGAACEAGAYIGKGTPRQRMGLKNFGEEVGVAFQIQDDILNLMGEEKKYKKEIGGDITEGKRTLIVIDALETLHNSKRRQLLKILSSQTRDKRMLAWVISTLEKNGSIEKAQKFAKDLAMKAKKELGVLPQGPAKAKLMELANFLVDRKV
ncbi:MAG: polyprenyl synthetase family protein [Candidatus Burarchaeum sp.]|nr:polyprenyl synthetase family protein [Candidatus Burarchaeum sp.]MDO8340292.1 polyprenyl synthetase family protein [Candidatus Burarchaeum sp.]